jgi:hypothetical protein
MPRPPVRSGSLCVPALGVLPRPDFSASCFVKEEKESGGFDFAVVKRENVKLCPSVKGGHAVDKCPEHLILRLFKRVRDRFRAQPKTQQTIENYRYFCLRCKSKLPPNKVQCIENELTMLKTMLLPQTEVDSESETDSLHAPEMSEDEH